MGWAERRGAPENLIHREIIREFTVSGASWLEGRSICDMNHEWTWAVPKTAFPLTDTVNVCTKCHLGL